MRQVLFAICVAGSRAADRSVAGVEVAEWSDICKLSIRQKPQLLGQRSAVFRVPEIEDEELTTIADKCVSQVTCSACDARQRETPSLPAFFEQ